MSSSQHSLDAGNAGGLPCCPNHGREKFDALLSLEPTLDSNLSTTSPGWQKTGASTRVDRIGGERSGF